MVSVMKMLREMEGSMVRVQMFAGETITGRLGKIDGSGKLVMEDCIDEEGNRVQMMILMETAISHIDILAPPMGMTLDDMVLYLLKERKASSLKEVAQLLDEKLEAVRRSVARLAKNGQLPGERVAELMSRADFGKKSRSAKGVRKRAKSGKGASKNRVSSASRHGRERLSRRRER